MIEIVIPNMFLFSLIDFKDLWAFINSVIQFNTNCDSGIQKKKKKRLILYVFSFGNFYTLVVVNFAFQQLLSYIARPIKIASRI